MFGVSFTEFVVILLVGLIVLGPQKLPGMFRSIGEWISRIRKITTEVRANSGIDEILRTEGLHGGLSELRGIIRSEHRTAVALDQVGTAAASDLSPYNYSFDYDITRERPIEGPDSYDAISEDLGEPKQPTTSTPT